MAACARAVPLLALMLALLAAAAGGGGQLTAGQHPQLEKQLAQVLAGAVLAMRPTPEQRVAAAEAADAALRSAGNGGTMETLRGLLQKVDPLHLPGPYEQRNLGLPGTDITLDLQVRDTKMVGVSNLDGNVETDIVILPPGLAVTLDVGEPLVNLSTGYFFRTHSANPPVWGNGTLGLVIRNLKISGKVQVAVKLFTKPYIKNSTVNLDGADVKVDITGLYGGGLLSEIVTEIVSVVLPEILPELLQKISEIINVEVVEIGNEVLRNMSFADLVNIIKQITSMPLP